MWGASDPSHDLVSRETDFTHSPSKLFCGPRAATGGQDTQRRRRQTVEPARLPTVRGRAASNIERASLESPGTSA